MSWGIHSGKTFSEVPLQYLEWFVKNAFNQMQDRKRWAEEEIQRRKTHNK